MRWWRKGGQLATAAVVGVIAGLTIGTLVNTIILASQSRREANKYATEYAAKERSQIAQRCGILLPSDRADCRQRVHDRAREQQRREYEVEAQRNAAIWNAAMGKASLIGLLFGLASVLLILATFAEQRFINRRSRLQFLISRKHDRTSLAHTQWATHQQLRPYVFVDKIVAEQLADRVFRVCVSLKNFGETPARNLESIITSYVTYDLHKLRSHRPRADRVELGTVPPNAFRRAFVPLIFSEKQWEAPLYDRAWGVLRVKYSYTDDSGSYRFEEEFDYHTDPASIMKEEPLFYLLTKSELDYSKKLAARQGEFVLPLRRSRLARRKKSEPEEGGDQEA